MSNTKYIIFEDRDAIKAAIIFPNHITHLTMANVMFRLRLTPVSAGFVDKDAHGKYFCHGRSESLNLNGKPTDAFDLNRILK